ncbi:DUF6417 family protein [Streptomyces sp. NPDC058293]|uniref:DUF6417 family protein n=1 Tax=Streptomyces sp. NPDC058293 TaxID=3346429 RepID=UPI0036F139FF
MSPSRISRWSIFPPSTAGIRPTPSLSSSPSTSRDAPLSALRVVRNARCNPRPLVRVEASMDANEHTAVAGLISVQDDAARRLAILTLDEAHDLLRLLQLIAAEEADELSQEADWFAREITARIPSEN